MPLSRVPLCAALWAEAHQAPLSVGFSGQEYWSGLPFPPPGGLPEPGIEPRSPTAPALSGGVFTTEPPGKPQLPGWASALQPLAWLAAPPTPTLRSPYKDQRAPGAGDTLRGSGWSLPGGGHDNPGAFGSAAVSGVPSGASAQPWALGSGPWALGSGLGLRSVNGSDHSCSGPGGVERRGQGGPGLPHERSKRAALPGSLHRWRRGHGVSEQRGRAWSQCGASVASTGPEQLCPRL